MEEAISELLEEAPGDVGELVAAVAVAARSASGRRTLASLDAVPVLLKNLQRVESPPLLLQILRALRNLCAGEAMNQDVFVFCSGAELVTLLAHKVVAKVDAEYKDVAKALLQLLGNVAGRGEDAQVHVCSAVFSNVFLDLVTSATLSSVEREPLCMLLYTCCKTSWERRVQICQGEGARLLALLLNDSTSQHSDESFNQWLRLLVEELCIKDQCFPEAFRNIGPAEEFSPEQPVLLSMICSILEDKQEAGEPLSLPNSVPFLINLIEQAALTVHGERKDTSLPTGVPTFDVLGLGLLLGKLIFSHEDPELENANDVFRMLDLCLDMLRALGPPAMIRKTLGKAAAEEPGSSRRFPAETVYRGYRRDIVAIIANLSFRSYQVQEQVRQRGGLLLVLQQCVLDEENPYLREWGLWAIRNLTEGSDENVQELKNLEVRSAVNTEELLKAGLKVEVDSQTRRPKLVNSASGE